MIQGLYTVAEVNAMIEKGDILLLAGDSVLLSQLNKGKWICGSTSRFIEMGKEPICDRNRIFVHNLTDIAEEIKLDFYDASTIKNIYEDAFENGFSVLITSPFSDVVGEYTNNCSKYTNFGSRALCGWAVVTSIYSEYELIDESLIFSGIDAKSYNQGAVVMHVGLPTDKFAEIHVFSPYNQPKEGDIITFEENKQFFEYALINGKRQNFRNYLEEIQKAQKREVTVFPYRCLIGNYEGIVMNVALATEKDKEYVTLGASVYKGIEYRLSNTDIIDFESMKKNLCGEIVFSLSCVNNFMKKEIFKNSLTQMNGPFTYGELAYYMMTNATIYVTVGKKIL